ncbi:PTS mannitol transporter subunit IICBA [uncultured Oscillibacter sp.]|jgi:PTS system mannitol-specific IIC component|uniref:PTS mannitol transporter subunit IICBA n=1 Tax=uncultured Oscillibacter sp. TaxID=876091 RepID=UPI0021736F5B|nr:PTS mannitol transporter subunit IICBA [uncultured Oscillibacter sp.]MCI9555105.1 PTS mannitol transporter subunit IICBA [Oscillibacter sp.]
MKERVQKFGRFLSGMVMPNIGAFIAWGLIAAFFIPDGWFPNETINGMVGPMLRFLLPILIGYTGGKAVGGQKGAVTGALATLGAIAATESTMFIGAMICGPLGGWCIKKFDKAMEGHIPAGFEMVVNNFSVGIIGAILAILSIYVIAPVCVTLTGWLGAGVEFLVAHSLLPLTAILVEPAKVLFLNNAINHGVFTPIGTEQAMEMGKSILFMIESNPGPGLGLLLAYCVAGKGETRSSAGAAAVIQFVGGIHEIYFPYVLMNPIVILGPMIGNVVGIFTLSALGGGLAAAASPGSIIAEMLMTPKGGYFANIAGIAIAAVVSFLISVFLLKFFGKDASLEEAQAQVAASKAASKGQAAPAVSSGASVSAQDVKKIVFACDAGMGSSAMGATMVRNKLKDAGITDIEVIHFPVGEIPGDCQIVVTHHELSGRAAQRAPQARIIPIKNFMGAPEYNTLVQELLDARKGGAPAAAAAEEKPAADQPILLEKKNIILNCKPVSPEEAIKAVGKLMVESGYVEEAYIQGMLDREASFSVAIGSHVAIPHGTEESRKAIKKTGLIVMTYPEGIEWGDETVRLVVGIASTGEDHLGILGKIVEVAETEEDTDALVDNASVDQLYKLLNGLE